MEKKFKIVSSVMFLVAALFFTALVGLIDVKAIGPDETKVGFAGINNFFHKLIGVHTIFYTLTQLLGYLTLLIAAGFAGLGVYQLVKRKSFAKVDKKIYALGGLYFVTIIFYFIFEKVVINYRPVLMDGELTPEPSFPSSHTMLACVVLVSGLMVYKDYILDRSLQKIIDIAALALLIIIVLGRLASGVHWFTDIVGGVLYSAALLFMFKSVIDYLASLKPVSKRPGERRRSAKKSN